jgi:hypothetical protein
LDGFGHVVTAACDGPSDPAAPGSRHTKEMFVMRGITRSGLALVGVVVGLGLASTAAAEAVYVDGKTYEINATSGPIFGAPQALLDTASPIYIVAYPVAPGTSGPITLPSGYQPQHNGFPPSPLPYHDHVLVSVPGDSAYVAPLRVVEMRYTWAEAYGFGFVPVTSYNGLVAGEALGIFDQVDPGAGNSYEHWSNTVLVRPVVRSRS